MGIFDKLREPVILKEDSEAKKQLEQLNLLLQEAKGDVKTQIEQDIKNVQCGIYGEESLMFELKNCHIPMYILHDLFFEKNGLTTQIDYLVVTRKMVVIMECKNLYGDIAIDNQGNFTRKIQIGNRYIKKGIYSPVTQNQRHLDLIHEMRREAKPSLLRSSFDKHFDEFYKSIIVLANPNSILDMRFAPKDIKEKVVKVDGLISYIKVLQNISTASSMSDKEMKELADFFLERNVVNKKDYTEKYKKSILESVYEKNEAEETKELCISAPVESAAKIEDTPLYKALKDYRLKKSREEGVKPYVVYNNSQLEEIVKSPPETLEAMKRINGFGEVRCSKYGEDILKVISEYQNK